MIMLPEYKFFVLNIMFVIKMGYFPFILAS